MKNNRKFENMLDNVIYPLIKDIKKLYKKPKKSNTEEVRLYEILAIAVLKGTQISELNMAELDKRHEKTLEKLNEPPLTEIEQNMQRHQQAKNSAANLSMGKGGKMTDGTPRFVTPDQFDSNGQYKGDK